MGIYCRRLCCCTEFFEYTIGNLIGDVAGVLFLILRKNRANSLDKIFITERLVEGRKFDPPILPILSIPLQDLFMVFCLNIF